MIDDSSATPQDEVEASETSEPAIDNLPASVILSGSTDEATQTMATDVSAGDRPTVSSLPSAEAAPAGAFVPTIQATPQIAPAPVYEQFGAASETVQPFPYAAIGPVTPAGAQIQSQATALSAQGTFAPYPGQPGQFYANQPGQPGAQVFARKRRPLLWVAVALIVIILFGGSAALTYALTQPQTAAPNATLQTYCQAIKNADAQGMYNLLSQQAKTHTSLDDLQRTFNSFDTLSSLGMKISDCTFSDLRVSGSLAVATISLTLSMTFEGQTTTITTPNLVSLVQENNQWKIDFSNFAQPQPNINLPGLQLTNVSSN